VPHRPAGRLLRTGRQTVASISGKDLPSHFWRIGAARVLLWTDPQPRHHRQRSE
jgi:hypothetical protein